jgi:hypothetical protein
LLGVAVGVVFLGVAVGVGVGVFVDVPIGVCVGVLVGVLPGAGVHATTATLCAAPPPINCPLSVPDARRKSPNSPAAQLGAVSCKVPEQLLPGVPAGASVVTGTPFTRHGAAAVEPPVQVGGLGQGTVFVTVRPVT